MEESKEYTEGTQMMERRRRTVLALFAVVVINDVVMRSNALRLNTSSPSEKKRRPRPQKKKPLRQPLKTSLKSIARAARDGSSTWGDHITSLGRASNRKEKQYQSTSMKQSSSIFISKLHKKIQTQQQNPKKTRIRSHKHTDRQYDDGQYDAGIEELIDHNSHDYPEEHFMQEILAVVVSGAAATSAFAAVSTGAFIATL